MRKEYSFEVIREPLFKAYISGDWENTLRVVDLSDTTEVVEFNYSNTKRFVNAEEIYFPSSAKITVLERGVPDRGLGVFRNCSKLSKLSIPGSGLDYCALWMYFFPQKAPDEWVNFYIYNADIAAAFPNFTDLTITGGGIPSEFCKECTAIKTLTISKCATIPPGAFFKCSNLETVNLEEGLIRIYSDAFRVCSSLKSITIPDSVIDIWPNVFLGCHSLADVKIGRGISVIPAEMFFGCDGLKNVEIPDTIIGIGDSAFSSCSSLPEINIPNSVTSIGDSAFSGCRLLNSIIFDGTVEQWNAIVKGEYWNRNVPATYVQCTDGQVTL